MERDGAGMHTPPPWVHAAEWGPVYGEEEDLDRAIQDSLGHPHTHHKTSLPEHTSAGHMTSLPGYAPTGHRTSLPGHAPTGTSLPGHTPVDHLHFLSGHSAVPERDYTANSRDMLVIGYQPSPSPPSPHSEDQVTGYQSPGHSQHAVNPLIKDSSLPSSLQQLLDSNVRIGTNV